MKKSPFVALGAIAGTVGLLVMGAAPASASNSWGGYHWATTNGTAQLNVINSSTSDWTPRLQTAVSDWEKSTSLSLSISQGDTSSTARRRCAYPTGNAVRVCNYAYGNTGWSGIASIKLSDGTHISTGTDKQNETYLSSGTEAKRQHVVCQEVGHLFGLDHQFTNAGSCMDYAGIDDPAYTHPNQHDYDELGVIYNHGDSAAAAQPSSASKIKTGSTITSVLWVD
ncbi:hypothetical protein OG304_04685 [Streptomyces sp. NBC_00160]|uniref:hypothetical protein n=1 Tax=Streptomyces sp. NBC_00160 TaxID=2903628 RepID=UPI00224F7955|nr:hypothetical protein [Streptomyces sp. NBC_00160]MCX5302749.1 hypothetical protein [Streptomyces sp. NBC_00160]